MPAPAGGTARRVGRAGAVDPGARFLAAVLIAALLAGCDGVSLSPSSPGPETPTPAGPATTPPSPPPSLASPSAAASSLAPSGRTETARVVRVIDGDTIVVDRGRGPERLRYIGVDAPETVRPGTPVEWMGPQASAANRALVAGRTVVLTRDVSETDRYGRLLRYVWLRRGSGWTFVNLELVRRGFAQVETVPPDVRYVDAFRAGQAAARAADRGLWGPSPTP